MMEGKPGSVLGSEQQIAKEGRAVRLFASAPVRQAVDDLEEIYRQSPAAQRPDAGKTMREAAEASVFQATCAVLNKDPDRPHAFWYTTTQHGWDGKATPLSGAMIDNPDNIYRTVAIDGRAAYEIKGWVTGAGPTQETYVLHEELSGGKKDQQVRSNEAEAGSVSLHDLTPGPDGAFTITIDNTPANGRINHLQTDPDVHDGYILIRSTLADWSVNSPSRLEARRVSGPPARPEADDEALANTAAELARTTGRYWLSWCQKFFFDRQTNAVTHDFARVSGWGHVSCGQYQLEADEALLVHLEHRDAAYLGFQLSDNWGQGQALRYIEKLGCLNKAQVRENPDGTVTYVIAHSDPGVHNWLDTVGSAAGTFGIRWQKLPPNVGAGDAIRRIAVVKLKDLPAELPPGTPLSIPAEREEQLAARKRDYLRRLTL